MAGLIHQAIYFAVLAHRGQVRKGSDIPYIVHPFEVAQILSAHGAEEEVIAAGILHDTVEDTSTTLDEIEERFGLHVARLVQGCSENKALSWEARREQTLHFLKTSCPRDTMLIVCADKLSNMRSTAEDYVLLGDRLWARFHRGKEKQKWYFESLLVALRPVADTEMYKELFALVEDVFGPQPREVDKEKICGEDRL